MPPRPSASTSDDAFVGSFMQLRPFVYGAQPPHLSVGDDDVLEVKLWEEMLGSDRLLGGTEVRRAVSPTKPAAAAVASLADLRPCAPAVRASPCDVALLP